MRPNLLVDSRDVRFILFEMFDILQLSKFDIYKDFDRDTYESVLDLAETIAMEEIYPANTIADKEGIKFDPDTHTVVVPQVFKKAMHAFNEAGFTGIAQPISSGGMGMPELMYRMALEYFLAASISFTIYITLSNGATNLVRIFGNEEQKRLYLGNMVSGKWGGTMCLTEPQAGSDVGAIKTKAYRQSDGTYSIKGQKIFISSGENDLYENIIHMVLARIDGDPDGTKGLSLFLVPKILVNSDGTLGKRNDVICTGVEHKMGIKASATCTLSFGDNDCCVGYLLGNERDGIKNMFHMMNEARLDVGLEGLGVSSAAYMHAVQYAKLRVQGKTISKSEPTIIGHPDVKRMLLWMKSHVEAMRMLVALTAFNIDISRTRNDEIGKKAHALVEFLIPICKAGNTDLSWLITAEAVQVFGGYGYCGDYPVEQYARDAKILSIYEGTNGIQSIDLAMRKIVSDEKRERYNAYKEYAYQVLKNAGAIVPDAIIKEIEKAIKEMDSLIGIIEGKDASAVLSIATPLQQAFRILTHGILHVHSMTIAIKKLSSIVREYTLGDVPDGIDDNNEVAFYYGKVLSAQFFLNMEFPKYYSLLDSIRNENGIVMKAKAAIFTGVQEA
ncbi:MAG: acyl-CoA dehydrogenase [Spirochaetes bacterium]|nr:acyl-CoA dehydrogenase [Spirochaetota bacterium]